MNTTRSALPVKARSHKWGKREALSGYLFILPNFIGFCLFTAIPIIFGFILSFNSYDGFNKMVYVGLNNYNRLFTDANVKIALKNNFLYTLVMVPMTVIVALTVATLIHLGIKRFKGTFKALLFLPNITSSIAIAVMWKQMFNPNSGPINAFLKMFGVANPPSWLASSQWAMLAVIIVAIWQSLGFNMVLLLAGHQGISQDLYDAAAVDGAVGWTKFYKITLPLLSPVIFFVTIMATINSFKVFELVFQMTNGGPGRATIVLVYRIFMEAFQYLRFGYASAQAYLLFAIILVFTFIQFRLQNRWVYYGD